MSSENAAASVRPGGAGAPPPDRLRCAIRSEPDVQISIYDSAGFKRGGGIEHVAVDMPRGIYRVQLDRCGFASEHLVRHDSTAERVFEGPRVESAAPVEISTAFDGYAVLAQQLSAPDKVSSVLSHGAPADARLFVFIHRRGPFRAARPVPGEPIAIHDAAGRCLVTLSTANAAVRNDDACGYLALSSWIAPGTYRLRIGDTPRDLAITIPRGRAAHVFLAEGAAISLRSARVYLPRIDAAFEPSSQLARAMESVLWAIGQADEALPAIARELLPSADQDWSFAIACAHLMRRQQDPQPFEAMLRMLTEQVPDLPDVTLLARTQGARDPKPAVLETPPLFRASFELAAMPSPMLELRGALMQATKTRYDDSIWCTWSPRWWDERWISPTLEQLRAVHDRSRSSVAAIAGSTRLPIETVQHTFDHLDRLDAGLPGTPTAPARSLGVIPGYELCKILDRGRGSTVIQARRDRDEREVAIKVIPAGSPELRARIEREIAVAHRHGHRHLVAIERWGLVSRGVAPSDPVGIWLELELCVDSLFHRLAVRDRPLPPPDAYRSALEALEALGYLHHQGIAHGAIHPGCLLIRKDESVALGIGGLVDRIPTMPDAGRDDRALQFLAPECVLSAAEASARADVWSVAATLYFLLTLELPRERYADQTEQQAARDNAIVPLAARMDLPGPISSCIARALSPQAADRFCDAQAFHAALAIAVGESETIARANALYDAMTTEDPACATTIRDLFVRMTELVDGEVRGRRVLRRELDHGDPVMTLGVRTILDRFCGARLIEGASGEPAGSEPELVPVGELLRGWDRIRDWLVELDEAPGARTLLADLIATLRRAEPRPKPWKADRAALAVEIEKRGLFRYNAAESDFIRRSNRRKVGVRIGISVSAALPALVLAISLGSVYAQRQQALETVVTTSIARDQAQQTLTRSLKESGRQLVLAGQPQRAIPFLFAAGTGGELGPPLQMLFHVASHSLVLDHGDTVTAAAFSPDGQWIATSGNDNTARIWNAETGKQIAALVHDGPVVNVAFSPDGLQVVTASEDHTARIWDAATGDSLQILAHQDFVQSAVFSSDGRHVVTASFDHTARIWNARTGRLEHELSHPAAVWSAALSPDGARVVTACRDGVARIWDAATGTLERQLKHSADVLGASFSPDGTRVVTASRDHTAMVWDAISGKPLTQALKHGDGVNSARFDGSGTRVVTTSYDSTARVWDARTGEPVTPWLEHQGSVASAMFSPRGAYLVTASSDGKARVWDARTGQLVAPVFEHTAPVTSAVFSGDGARVLTASFDRSARTWSIAGDGEPRRLAFDGDATWAAFSADATRMVTTIGDYTARTWDTATGRLAGPPLVHPARVKTAELSPDSTQVVTMSEDKIVRVWDAANGRVVRSVMVDCRRSTEATFSPDGAQVVIVGASCTRPDDRVLVWDLRTDTTTPRSVDYQGDVTGAWFSPDGTHFVTTGDDQTARIWNAADSKPVALPLVHRRSITSVAFSPDGKRVVTASDDRTAQVWDAATGARIASLDHQGRVVCAAFSPDGDRIVTASDDQTARVWDATTGRPLTSPLLHADDRVAFVGRARRVRAWDDARGASPADDAILAVTFSRDGQRILTADDHAIRTWDAQLDTRSLDAWQQIAADNPYIVKDGMLILRDPSARERPPGLAAALVSTR
jgi:WD40 repeat protein/serine/threonine protein kinase